MARIELKNLYHKYDQGPIRSHKRNQPVEADSFALQHLDLVWEDGSANALLGPSGCGKTTLLNIISGLLTPTGGQVLFDGEDVTNKPCEDRRIAQVFQFPVVYDSMSVYGNLAFPLKNDGMPDASIKERVREIAEILEIDHLLSTGISRLTGADKQRVALGRGLVRPKPAAVLLDEPLTVIDPKQQWGLRRKLRQVQQQLGITMIYVTHDQHEALTFADQVTVMSDGNVVQMATPEELHNEPATPFVGYFIGSPGMNIFECDLTGGSFQAGPISVPISKGLRQKIEAHNGPYRVGVRPENLEVSTDKASDTNPFKVLTVENNGAYKIVTLEESGIRLKARVGESTVVLEDDLVWVRIPEEHIKVFKNDRRIDL